MLVPYWAGGGRSGAGDISGSDMVLVLFECAQPLIAMTGNSTATQRTAMMVFMRSGSLYYCLVKDHVHVVVQSAVTVQPMCCESVRV